LTPCAEMSFFLHDEANLLACVSGHTQFRRRNPVHPSWLMNRYIGAPLAFCLVDFEDGLDQVRGHDEIVSRTRKIDTGTKGG